MERTERWSSTASPPSILRLHSVLPQTLSSCIPSVTTHSLLKNYERKTTAVYVHVPQISSNKCSILKKNNHNRRDGDHNQENDVNKDVNSISHQQQQQQQQEQQQQQQQQQPTASILKHKNTDKNQSESNTSGNHISHHHHHHHHNQHQHHHHSVPVTYSTSSSISSSSTLSVDFLIPTTTTTTTTTTMTTTTTTTTTTTASTKRHGILKKRSSLDESQIIRRRSCSPDVSLTKTNFYSDFKPILKHQRRSSLDEMVRRAQSPDLHPTSILKHHNVTRDNDRELNNFGNLSEPQGILKRKSWSNIGESAGGNTYGVHVNINNFLPKLNNLIGNNCGSELVDISEVRPILKKKHSREDSLNSESVSLEPRPILKKKSSLECEESVDDKPKKTILKSLQKQSVLQQPPPLPPLQTTSLERNAIFHHDYNKTSSNDCSSPKKLSSLKNCFIQTSSNLKENCLIDNPTTSSSRPILKQNHHHRRHHHSTRYSRDDFDDYVEKGAFIQRRITGNDSHSNDLFFRKRAQSVEHVFYSSEEVDTNEPLSVLSKRRSLESVYFEDEYRQDNKYDGKFISKGISELPNDFLSLSCTQCLNDVSTTALKIPDRS